MEMMRAVLDSNFWLATHVVAITIGYSSTYLAGMLGIGLHSYGFMDKAFLWLSAFAALQLALMGLGALPPRFWVEPRPRD